MEKFKVVVFLFLMLSLTFPDKASAELTIKTNNTHIKINPFYHGSTINVAGDAALETDLIIKISSQDRHEVLKQKGKVFGLLWMNTETLNLEDVPNIYFIYSTKKIENIMSSEEMDKYVLGYSALSRHIKITPALNENERLKWFNEFVQYKKSSNLYTTSQNSILTLAKNGKQAYSLLVPWPYQAPPDNYIVTVYEVKDKRVIEKVETNVLVESVGIVKVLAHMAKNNGAIYGVISILAALIAGFGTGLVFRKSGGSH